MSTRKIVFIYCLIAFYSVAPILCVLISSIVASATGSRLDESGSHPSIVLGVDIGGLIHFMFVAGWFAFFTIPTGFLTIVVFTVVLLIKRRKVKNL